MTALRLWPSTLRPWTTTVWSRPRHGTLAPWPWWCSPPAGQASEVLDAQGPAPAVRAPRALVGAPEPEGRSPLQDRDRRPPRGGPGSRGGRELGYHPDAGLRGTGRGARDRSRGPAGAEGGRSSRRGARDRGRFRYHRDAEQTRELLRVHRRTKSAGTILTTEVAEPGGYARIERDGTRLLRIVEGFDAPPELQAVKEVSLLVFVFQRSELFPAVARRSAATTPSAESTT